MGEESFEVKNRMLVDRYCEAVEKVSVKQVLSS